MTSLRSPLKSVGDDGAHHQPRPLVEPRDWRLEVSGRVTRPLSLSLDALTEFAAKAGDPPRSQRIVCVSAANIVTSPAGEVSFGGPDFATLARHVEPLDDPQELSPDGPPAAWVELVSRAPGTLGPRDQPHRTCLPLADALDPRYGLRLATTLGGEPLPYRHGGPLRAVVGPELFFYKAVKWLAAMRLVRPADESGWSWGTWEEHAGYHRRARTALDERFEPTLHRILEARRHPDGTLTDVTEEIPESGWKSVFQEMYQRRDLSRLIAAQLHKIVQPLPKDFAGVSFSTGDVHAKIRGTSFASADFTGADLSGGNFSLSKFTNAHFSNDGDDPADLSGADFEGAYFNNAHLQNVSFRGATLTGATFVAPAKASQPTGRIRDLDLRDAKNLDPETRAWLLANGARV